MRFLGPHARGSSSFGGSEMFWKAWVGFMVVLPQRALSEAPRLPR